MCEAEVLDPATASSEQEALLRSVAGEGMKLMARRFRREADKANLALLPNGVEQGDPK